MFNFSVILVRVLVLRGLRHDALGGHLLHSGSNQRILQQESERCLLKLLVCRGPGDHWMRVCRKDFIRGRIDGGRTRSAFVIRLHCSMNHRTISIEISLPPPAQSRANFNLKQLGQGLLQGRRFPSSLSRCFCFLHGEEFFLVLDWKSTSHSLRSRW